jgi:hypothetical protein
LFSSDLKVASELNKIAKSLKDKGLSIGTKLHDNNIGLSILPIE